MKFISNIYSDNKYSRLILLIVAIISIAVIYLTGQQLLELPLWGYKPLTFFLAWWVLLNVVFSLIGKKSHSRKYFFLSTIAGCFLHFGFPDVSFTPLIFIAFLPILYIVESEYQEKTKASAWRVFRYSYSAFLLWNILTTFWVANTSFMPSVIAFTLNALFMTIPIMFYFYFRRSFKSTLSGVAFIAFWLAFETIHLRWEISWPWLTLGNAFASRSLWIQWYEITGHMGGSLWVLLMNWTLFRFVFSLRKKEVLKVQALLYPVAILMVPIMLSFFLFFRYIEKGNPVNVAVVQPNFEPHYEKFDVSEAAQYARFLKLSEQVITDSTHYLVFPETAFGCYDVADFKNNEVLQGIKGLLDSFPKTRLITGLCSYEIYDEKSKDMEALREISRGGEKKYMQLRNAAYEINADGVTAQEHIKGKLVPGAEIFPYSDLLFFFEPIVKKAGGSTIGHATAQPTNLTNGVASVAPAICYESIYGYWMRKFVLDGAELIFVVTNDGWWDNTPGHRQHLAFSILRAIETRRSIARSANTGVSCFIDQHGRVWDPTLYGEEATISRKMLANNELTFFVRNGDIVGRLSLLLSAICLAFMMRTLMMKRKKSQSQKKSD